MFFEQHLAARQALSAAVLMMMMMVGTASDLIHAHARGLCHGIDHFDAVHEMAVLKADRVHSIFILCCYAWRVRGEQLVNEAGQLAHQVAVVASKDLYFPGC